MARNRRRALLLSLYLFPFMLNIALIDFMIPVKYDAVLENLPLLGFLVTLAWVASSFLDFAVGDLTDRIGIRKTIQLGVLLSFAGSLIFALSGNFVVMTFGIFLWGLSYVMFTIPSDTLVFSAFPKDYVGSAYGLLYFAYDIAYAAAPLLAYAIVMLFGINAAIVSAALITLLTLPLTKYIRSSGREGVISAVDDIVYKDGFFRKELKDIKKMGVMEFSLLINMFVCGFWFITVMLAAPLLFLHGKGNLLNGALLTFAFMLPFAFMELVYGRIANSHTRRVLMIDFGFAFSALFLILFYFTESFLLMLALACLTTLTANMAWSGSEVHISEYLPKKRKGEFMGIFDTGKDLGYDLAPLFYGIFASISLKLPFLVLGIMLFSAWILFWAAEKAKKQKLKYHSG